MPLMMIIVFMQRTNYKDNLQRHYSFREKLQLGWFWIRTKLIGRSIRLIRFPIIIRGRQYIDFGNNLTTGFWCRLEVFLTNNDGYKRIIFGDNIQINDFVHICALEHVEIGDGCLFASHIYISDNKHGIYNGCENDSSPLTPPDHREYITKPVIIGKNVWIGEGVIVLPGVTIGDGCVIGAHSVVNKDIPSNCIAVGSPIRIVKQYSLEEKCWMRL